jgi:glycosyltransferase involved in cell wall biosynthesis
VLSDGISDLFIVEHQLFPYVPFFVENRFLPERYLVEFDDAIYLTHPRKLPQVIGRSTGVIAGNRTLAEYAGRFHANVHVVPTVLDTEVFRPRPKRPGEKVTFGWSGLEYNFKYIRSLEPVLFKLLKRYPIELLILSGAPPTDFAFPFRFLRWNPSQEAEQIAEMDIGLMPLQFDEWCAGKCGIKLLQYMSLGIPTVATPVGVNSEIIQNGENGFLARTDAEWEEALANLVEDRSLRERIGETAHAAVEERYSVRTWFPRLLKLYRSYSSR